MVQSFRSTTTLVEPDSKLEVTQSTGARRTRLAAGAVPLAVDAAGIRDYLPIARSTWLKWSATGLTPRPRRIGGRVLWDLAELYEWFAAGTPNRERWDAMRAEREEAQR